MGSIFICLVIYGEESPFKFLAAPKPEQKPMEVGDHGKTLDLA